jgi:AraC-like DNA-binding protein
VAGDLDSTALLLRALDLLPFGVVACDPNARLSFGNRIIDDMVGGLRIGQPAAGWPSSYGLADATGRVFERMEDIPLVRALSGPAINPTRMRQRCGAVSIELIAHTRPILDPDRHLLGAVGVFVPVAMIARHPSPRLRPGVSVASRPRSADLVLVAGAIELAEQVIGAVRPSDALIDRIVEYVRAHQTQQIRLPQIAAALGYNATHLTTMVRRRTGQPLMQLVLRVRLESARSLLELTDLPVTAVARRSGPWDADYFARLFHRRYGCTPSAWRAGYTRQGSSGSAEGSA